MLHSNKNKMPILLIGHSLGGILAREIALFINKQNAQQQQMAKPIRFIVAIDSWVMGTENLDLNIIREYLNVK